MDCICCAVYGLVTLWMGCALAPTARTIANPNVVMLRIRSAFRTPGGLLQCNLPPDSSQLAQQWPAKYTRLSCCFVTRVILIWMRERDLGARAAASPCPGWSAQMSAASGSGL